MSVFSSQIGQVVVVGMLSAADFGLYSVAFNASRTLEVIGLSLNTVLFPKAAGLETSAAVRLVNRSARIVLAANLLIGSLFILMLPILIRLAFGIAYVNDTWTAQVLTFEVIIGTTVTVLCQAFMATGRPGLVTTFQICGVCTTLPLMLLFVPRCGLVGAAYALLASTIIRLILVLLSYPIFLHEQIPRVILTRHDFNEIFSKLLAATGS